MVFKGGDGDDKTGKLEWENRFNKFLNACISAMTYKQLMFREYGVVRLECFKWL